MSASGRLPPEPPETRGFWPDWLSARRFLEFARKFYSLQTSVTRLGQDCQALRKHVATLQQQQAAQTRELALLVRVVETAINERIDIKAENAAYRILAGLQHLPKRDEKEEP